MSLDAVFASLPVPAILIDTDDTIAELNSEAEGFLNASAKSAGAMCAAFCAADRCRRADDPDDHPARDGRSDDAE